MTTNRLNLISSGEHIGAVRRLGESYSADEYLVAVEAARDAGDGVRYANAVLGPETVTATTEPDPTGADLHEAALGILNVRGKTDNYTQAEYLAACEQALAEAS